MNAPQTPGGDGPGKDAVGPGTDVERLTRWRAAGGGWRVIAHTPTGLTVALLTCDGGEEMERIVSSDPSFVAYVNAWSGYEP